MSHHHEDKKSKKKAQLKKNRKLQEIFQVMRLQRAETERIKEQDENRKPGSEGPTDEEVSDKMANIRNRLTNQRRLSRERWNRFATTGDSGGRGL